MDKIEVFENILNMRYVFGMGIYIVIVDWFIVLLV